MKLERCPTCHFARWKGTACESCLGVKIVDISPKTRAFKGLSSVEKKRILELFQKGKDSTYIAKDIKRTDKSVTAFINIWQRS